MNPDHRTATLRRRRRVCVISSVHPPFDPRIFHKEARSLAAAGYNVTLVVQHERQETVDGVRLLPLPRSRGRLRRMTGGPLRSLELALRQRADVYHLHDPELLPVGILLKLLTGARVVYDAHEDYPRDILTKPWLVRPLRAPVAIVFDAIEGLAARYLDAVVAATDPIAARFRRGGRTVAVRNFPILGLFPAADVGPAPRSTDAYTLIYTGSLTELRGVREMVRVVGLLAERYNVRLKLLGRFGDRELEESVLGMAEAAHVDYLGWVPHQEVHRHLAAADVGFTLLHPAPNHLEAMPTKLFEYMAMGLPVVASNFAAWQQIVEGNGCGVTVDPLDPSAVAEAIADLLERPQLRQEMGERGRRAVREKYSWESESQRLLALYQELTSIESAR